MKEDAAAAQGGCDKGDEKQEGDAAEAEATALDGYCQDKHIGFILRLHREKDTYEYVATEHLRVQACYWSIAGLDLVHALDRIDVDEYVALLLACQHENGGFGGNRGHDPQLLSTLSAVQILAIFDRLGEIDADKVAAYVAKLQQEDGSFAGDRWGETDSRFCYAALLCLRILGRLDLVDRDKAAEFIVRCRNFDGGFGTHPGSESHCGQIFCCVAGLAILGKLDEVDADVLGWWLAERQLPCGGLCGRPMKLQDVCYSWWVITALRIIRRMHWISQDKLAEYIMSCQDTEDGGIADRPGNVADVYHTYFGTAGLSLLGKGAFKPICPVYAMPQHVCDRMGLKY